MLVGVGFRVRVVVQLVVVPLLEGCVDTLHCHRSLTPPFLLPYILRLSAVILLLTPKSYHPVVDVLIQVEDEGVQLTVHYQLNVRVIHRHIVEFVHVVPCRCLQPHIPLHLSHDVHQNLQLMELLALSNVDALLIHQLSEETKEDTEVGHLGCVALAQTVIVAGADLLDDIGSRNLQSILIEDVGEHKDPVPALLAAISGDQRMQEVQEFGSVVEVVAQFLLCLVLPADKVGDGEAIECLDVDVVGYPLGHPGDLLLVVENTWVL